MITKISDREKGAKTIMLRLSLRDVRGQSQL